MYSSGPLVTFARFFQCRGQISLLNSSQSSPTCMGMMPVSSYSTLNLVLTSLMYCRNSSDFLVRFNCGSAG